MIAVIDVGNTRLKWALLDGDRLGAVASIAHLDGIDAALDSLITALPEGVNRALVANVAGNDFEARLADLLNEHRSIDVEFVATHARRFGIQCAYSDPERLGVDRWVAMIAARRIVTTGFCVIQAGTAVTFDAVDAAGQHLGGLIFAGPGLMADALNRSTGRIGATQPVLERPEGLALLGKSTHTAVGNGSMLAVAAALDRAIATITAHNGEPPVTLLTGGDAAALRPWLESDVRFSADLVLHGLAYIAHHDE
jgi:type III pantothenate kinase